MIQTETALCGYCEELPEKGRAAAAHVNHCPLCKAEVGITGSGRRFRIGADVPAPRGRRAMAAALALAGGAVVLAMLTWLAFFDDPAVEIVVLPPEPTPIVKTLPPVVDPHPVAPPQDVAVAKRYAEGVLSPEARMKPDGAIAETAAIPSAGILVARPLVAENPVHAPAPSAFAAPAATAFKVSDPYWDLLNAPEVALVVSPPVSKWSSSTSQQQSLSEAKQRIADLASSISSKNIDAPDGFVRSLIAKGGDLAELPYRLGKSCELSTGDAKQLRGASVLIRRALAAAQQSEEDRKSAEPKSHSQVYKPKSATEAPPPYSLWNHLRLSANMLGSSGAQQEKTMLQLLPGFTQILAAETPQNRVELIEQIRDLSGTQVTQALGRLAFFDPDPAVREKARESLRSQPAREYSEALLDAFRYAWPPVVKNAAAAAIELDRKDLVPKLIEQLDAADPMQPFMHEVEGKQVLAVRQLVKINHHRNCLLCHPPSATTNRDIPQGRVPSPAEPLPPPGSIAYYAQRSGETVVRADITYVRQDFSMLLPVAEAGPWPGMQRFDFVIRTHVLSESEVKAHEQQKRAPGPDDISPHRQGVLSALRALTGLDAGVSAAEWRKAVAAPSSASK